MAKSNGEKRAALLIEYIMDSLKNGQLRSGDKLPPEHALMKTTGISRSSVREALSALELVGVIRRQQGGGTYVKNTTPTMFGVNSDELFFEFFKDAESGRHSFAAYEARTLFEPPVAALAALRAEKEDIDELAAVMDRMRKAADDKNPEQMAHCDGEFHIAIAKATRNELIAKTMRRFIETASADMFRTYKRTDLKMVYEEHRGIFDAIRNGEENTARICCAYNLLKSNKPL